MPKLWRKSTSAGFEMRFTADSVAHLPMYLHSAMKFFFMKVMLL